MHTKYDMRVAEKIGEHHVECLECSYFGLVILDLVTYQHVHRFFLLQNSLVKGLALTPDDAWSVHSVAHVCEMKAELDKGLKFMESREKDWEVR